jgi:L-serine dehydratase
VNYPEFFNDVFGPVMQPGSSSHTAGPCRLGYLAACLLGERAVHARIVLDRDGSFAGTFGVMAEDRGMLAGVLGMLPDDARMFDTPKLAREAGLSYEFQFGTIAESRHPNAVKFVLTGQSGRVATLVGDSTGGGMIEIRSVNGCELRVKGDAYCSLVFGKDATALLECVETAVLPDLTAVAARWPGCHVALLRPVLPVLNSPDRKPQLFDTMTRWREIVADRDLPLWEVAVQYEIDASGWSRDRVLQTMRQIERVMCRQTHAVYDEALDVLITPFRPDMAGEWERHVRSGRSLTNGITQSTIKWAYGAGAGIPGVPGVAGPMGSGGGYIHAALWAVKEAHGFADDDLLRGLFIAAGIGAIAYTRTEPTGEVLGCTGECGICGAMAAAAIAEMAGGTPEQVENAASLSLQAQIGMPCDPIPGGCGQPCRSRIISATVMAHVFADLALAGRSAVLPLHEVIDLADHVGRNLPSGLLCTGRAGAPMTPAGRERTVVFQDWFSETEKDGTLRPPGNLI